MTGEVLGFSPGFWAVVNIGTKAETVIRLKGLARIRNSIADSDVHTQRSAFTQEPMHTDTCACAAHAHALVRIISRAFLCCWSALGSRIFSVPGL